MSNTAALHDTADALRAAANKVEDAEIRAEVAEASIELANENEEAALQIAADIMQNAMRTALGERLAAFEIEVKTCLEDLRSSLALQVTPPNLSGVEERLSRIEALIAELEAEELAERQSTLQQSTEIVPQSLPKEPKEKGAAESPVKKRGKVRNWI